ncbi:MAG: TetR family transcriptional regulator [Candidatus Rokuibacteriota bacterium]|jgi:TetR/AcrR family transcriptional repressor of nem operon|nr:MAG: TetR family transcriptional regulator [Candidatus Rokubacteria bacterium]
MATKTAASGIKARDGRSTREAILEAASRLIHVHGYNHTSLDDVLRESGVGKGNFYYHFKSKEELGYAILDQAIASFLAETLEPCFSDPGRRPLAQIRCFFDRVHEIQREQNCVGGCAFGNLAAELSDVHEGFRTRLAVVFSAWHERLTQALHEAHRRGDLHDGCRPEAVAHFLVASLEGAILLTKLTKDIAVMEQCVTEMNRYLSLYELGA